MGLYTKNPYAVRNTHGDRIEYKTDSLNPD